MTAPAQVPDVDRRTLLASLGATGTAGLAGCLDAVPGLGPTTKLGRLAVVNWDEDDPHTVDVRVERDDDVVHESTSTVGAMQATEAQAEVVECTWDDVARTYVVAARLAGQSAWRRFDLLAAADGTPDCVIARVQYGSPPGVDDPDRPLRVAVRDRCDEIAEHYVGGCTADRASASSIRST